MKKRNKVSSLGHIFKSGRIKKNLTQKQVAEMLNVTNKAVSTWESGTREPNLETFIKLVHILDIYDDIFLK